MPGRAIYEQQERTLRPILKPNKVRPYIEAFYNRPHLHSSMAYTSPHPFHQRAMSVDSNVSAK
jgi:hypothetical protein